MSINSKKKVLVCNNYRANPNMPSCAARGSADIFNALLSKELTIDVENSPCMGHCQIGPNVRLAPNGASFNNVTQNKIEKLIAEIRAFIAC